MPGKPVRTRILNHGRSGGVYIAKVLRTAGLDFGHEEDRRYGSSGTLFLKPPRRRVRPYGQTWHQVRHPLQVIASATTAKPENVEAVFAMLGHTTIEMDPLRKLMLLWVQYTKWADKQADWTYRVEQVPVVWPEMCVRLNIEPIPLPNIATDTNHRNHPELTWKDLSQADLGLAAKIKLKAKEYGYAET